MRDHGRAEDIAQEVFISALRRLRASSQEIAFKPWIYEIAKNACIDEYRRSARGREVPLEDEAEDQPSAGLLSTAPSPPAAIEAKERLSDLRGAFGVLSETHHQLIVMREFEGRSYDEIGERTGMSRQMVESALFRARRKLTDEYEELASGRRCVQIQAAIEAGRAAAAQSLGIRERRRFARHLAHCQPCRMHAQMADVDGSLLVTRTGLGAKIAALLPFPLLRWPWAGRRARSAVAELRTRPDALQTLHSASEPAAATSLGGAAVAVAVLALAGTGAVVAPDLSRGQGTAQRPAAHAAPAAPVGPRPRGPVDRPRPLASRRSSVPPRGARLQAGRGLARSGASATSGRRHASPSTSLIGRPLRDRARSCPAIGLGRSGGSPAPGPRTAPACPSVGARRLRPGTIVRASGGSLADTISAAGKAVAGVSGSLPVAGMVSRLGGSLAATTRSTANTLANSADAAADAVQQTAAATGPAAGPSPPVRRARCAASCTASAVTDALA